MIEVKPTKRLLYEFISNLRESDLLEFNELYKNSSLDEFYKVCLDENQDTYFLLTDDYLPLALGGAYSCSDFPNRASVWLLCTKHINKNKKELYKYIKNKIDFFKRKYNFLFNYIFKSNFSSLKWLKACGFSVLNTNRADYKLFYFGKGENCFDIRYFTR